MLKSSLSQTCVFRFDIAGGQVSYTSNFVKSEDYKINHQYERIILASFGTTSMPDPCKNVFSRYNFCSMEYRLMELF